MLNELQEMLLLSWIRTVISFGLVSLSCTASLKSSARKMSSTSLTLTLSAHIHWSKRGVWETSFGTMLKGKVEKTQPWNTLTVMWAWMLCLRKSSLALIQWQAVQGSFQQRWTFHCFLYSNLCPNSIKVHLLFLFVLGYKVKLMQQRHSQCHESFFHLSSNVPLKQVQTQIFPGYPSNA